MRFFVALAMLPGVMLSGLASEAFESAWREYSPPDAAGKWRGINTLAVIEPPPALRGIEGRDALLSVVAACAPGDESQRLLAEIHSAQDRLLDEYDMQRQLPLEGGTGPKRSAKEARLLKELREAVRALYQAEGQERVSKQGLALSMLAFAPDAHTVERVRELVKKKAIYEPWRAALLFARSGNAETRKDVAAILERTFEPGARIQVANAAVALDAPGEAIPRCVQALETAHFHGSDREYALCTSALVALGSHSEENRAQVAKAMLELMDRVTRYRQIPIEGLSKQAIMEDHDTHHQELCIESILGSAYGVLDRIGALRNTETAQKAVEIYLLQGGPIASRDYLPDIIRKEMEKGRVVLPEGFLERMSAIHRETHKLEPKNQRPEINGQKGQGEKKER